MKQLREYQPRNKTPTGLYLSDSIFLPPSLVHVISVSPSQSEMSRISGVCWCHRLNKCKYKFGVKYAK